MINNAIVKGNIYKKDDMNGLMTGVSTTGEHLLFTCINTEPEEQDQEWPTESAFLRLLEKGFDPNEISQTDNLGAIFYALKTRKFRAFKYLLTQPNLDFN
jgi:hypothetical protein